MNDDVAIEGALKEIIDRWRSDKPGRLNIFRLVSDVYHRENLHSDVIAKLLETETHPESIPAFIGLLNRVAQGRPSLNLERYARATIHRERDKTDIRIESRDNKHCIIVENKINNAVDQPEQLSRYFAAAEGRDLTVEVIVYLSKDGKKEPEERAFAESNRDDLKKKLLKVAAFAKNENDLVNGWLQPLLRKAEEHGDVELKHLLKQYIEILKEIGEHMMNNDVQKEFMQLLRGEDGYRKRAAIIADLYAQRLGFAFNDLTHKYTTEPTKSTYGVQSANWSNSAGYIVVAEGSVCIGIFEYDEDKLRVSVYANNGDKRGKAKLSALRSGISQILPESFDGVSTQFCRWPEDEKKLESIIEKALKLLSRSQNQ